MLRTCCAHTSVMRTHACVAVVAVSKTLSCEMSDGQDCCWLCVDLVPRKRTNVKVPTKDRRNTDTRPTKNRHKTDKRPTYTPLGPVFANRGQTTTNVDVDVDGAMHVAF